MIGERLSPLDRQIVALAVPALATLAVEPLYVLVDTAIVGRLGTTPLGGLALATTVLTTLLWVFNFLSFGTTARVAFLVGRGSRPAAAAVAAQGLWLSGTLGVPVAVAVGLGGRLLAGGLGGHGAVLDAAATYLRISALGMPAVLLALVGQGYLRGVLDTRTPFRVVIVANGLNVVLEVLLVYGFHTGIAGSAWGTVVAQWVAAVWFIALLAPSLAAHGVARWPVPAELRNLLSVGRHLFVRTGALLATLAAATAVAARAGTTTLAGHQIALQIETFLALAVDALAVAGQGLVGTRLGAGDPHGARDAGQRLLHLGVRVGGLLALAVVATSWLVPRLFSSDGAVNSRAEVGLVFVGVVQIPAAVAFVLDGVLMGASDFRFLQWAMLGAGLAFAPAGAAVLRWHRLGIAGVWCGLLVWMTARAAANAARARGQRWLAADSP